MKIIVILGPTASGKTALAVSLARRLSAEIISADSRQVYKGLDLGSGKDLAEYGEGSDRVPVHLIDILDPGLPDQFSLADFMCESKRAAAEIVSRGKVPLICGGTALYIHALIKGYELPGGPADREFRSRTESLPPETLVSMQTGGRAPVNGEENNPYRLTRKLEIRNSVQTRSSAGGPIPGAEYLVLGTFRPRAEVRARIEKRLDERFSLGMADEVKRIHESGVPWERLEAFGLEYREISRFLQNLCTFGEMRTELLTKIRQFAKRQDTFFRKMEREGVAIHWIPPEHVSEAEELCRRFLTEGVS